MKAVVFNDYPEFQPNLTPSDIFKLGSFGGTYWRPIYSSITKKKYENEHKDLVGFIRKLKKYKSNPKDHLDKIGEIEERVHYIFDEITMVSPPSYID